MTGFSYKTSIKESVIEQVHSQIPKFENSRNYSITENLTSPINSIGKILQSEKTIGGGRRNIKVQNLTAYQVRGSLKKIEREKTFKRINILGASEPIYQTQPLKIDLTNVMVKSNLDLISNEHLNRFIINSGQDNALT